MPDLLDDGDIVGSEVLLRRIARSGDANMLVTDEASGVRRVRGGAFCVDDDGCSIYFLAVLVENDLGPMDIVVAPQNVVVSVLASDVRDVAFGICRDPYPEGDGDHLRQAAHGLLLNSGGLGSKRLPKAMSALAKRAVIIDLDA